MAGQVRERKRWQLQGGPHGTLRRLRSQLAEDGCVESQLSLAKSLLEEAEQELDIEKEETAMEWLFKATQQNSSQATQLLKDCLQQNKGFDDGISAKAIEFLAMNKIEHQLRNSARNLFAELTVDGAPVSGEILLRRIRDSNNDTVTTRLVDRKAATYTEDDLIEIATQLARGQKIHRAVDWEELDTRYRNLTWKEKMFESRSSYLTAYSQTVEFLTKQGLSLISSKIILNLLAVLVLGLSISDPNLNYASILIFFASLIIMMVSAIEMFHVQRIVQSVRVWLLILKAEEIDSERVFLWKDGCTPYWRFFFASVCLVVCYPRITGSWIPMAELTVFSLAFALATFFIISGKKRWLVITSTTVNLAAIAWPTSSTSISLAPNISLRLDIYSALALVVPAVLTIVIIRQKFCNIHRVLFPHLVCIFWTKLAVEFYSEKTSQSLLPAAYIVGLIILTLPLMIHLITAITIVVIAYVVYAAPVWITLLLGLLIFPVLLQIFIPKEWITTWIRFISYATLAFLLLMTTSWQCPVQTSPSLDWPDYHKNCHQPAWTSNTGSSLARVQSACRHLSDVPISWTGTVHRVAIIKTANKLELVLAWTPEPLRSFFQCVFGEVYGKICRDISRGDRLQSVICRVRLGQCHLAKWDEHVFQIVLSLPAVPDTADVFVEADHQFAPFLLEVRRGDVILVNGTLWKDIGGPMPSVKLTGVTCVSCQNGMESVNAKVVEHTDFSSSLQFVVKFFLSPFVEFVENQ